MLKHVIAYRRMIAARRRYERAAGLLAVARLEIAADLADVYSCGQVQSVRAMIVQCGASNDRRTAALAELNRREGN